MSLAGRLATHSVLHRVRRRSEYERCYEAGRRYGSRSFLVFVRPRLVDATTEEGGACGGRADVAQAPVHRLGTAVSRKIGKAVVRNRCKRLLREWFRLHRAGLDWPEAGAAALGVAGLDLVVVPRRGTDVLALTLDAVARELTPLARRAWRDCLRQAQAAFGATPSLPSPASPGAPAAPSQS